jgi:hypothetical protein
MSTFKKDGKEYPIIEVSTDDGKIKLSFGASKARMLLNNIDAIRSFVQSNSNGR